MKFLSIDHVAKSRRSIRKYNKNTSPGRLDGEPRRFAQPCTGNPSPIQSKGLDHLQSLNLKARSRPIMAPDRWTELFFLDEATAFAAGHRPCCECRRDDFNRFKNAWLKGNPEYNFSQKTSIHEIDKILHQERIGRDQSKITFEANPADLPDGSFVLFNQGPFLVFDNKLFQWSPFGYEKGIAMPEIAQLPVLTPRSVVNAFRAGYIPTFAGFPGNQKGQSA